MLQKLIVPRERRVIVYNILNNEIINVVQKKEYPSAFRVDISDINNKRNECILLTTEKENLYSYVYVHSNGEIETEVNVKWTKYAFHKNYND
ncbi:MAG: hypothetical protein ACK452_12295 [Bacteroidota bacterium]|jgi:hypothetical protein